MSAVLLERYIRAKVLADLIKSNAANIKLIMENTSSDRRIKAQSNLILKESLKLNDLMDKRLLKIRKDFDLSVDDFDIDIVR